MINGPAQQEWYCCLSTPNGGETVGLRDASSVETYNSNPDAFAASHFGLSISEYREWIESKGGALCSERTQKGRACRNTCGAGYQLDSVMWRKLHRNFPCVIHGGEPGAAMPAWRAEMLARFDAAETDPESAD
jgi:hypothetical protein